MKWWNSTLHRCWRMIHQLSSQSCFVSQNFVWKLQSWDNPNKSRGSSAFQIDISNFYNSRKIFLNFVRQNLHFCIVLPSRLRHNGVISPAASRPGIACHKLSCYCATEHHTLVQCSCLSTTKAEAKIRPYHKLNLAQWSMNWSWKHYGRIKAHFFHKKTKAGVGLAVIISPSGCGMACRLPSCYRASRRPALITLPANETPASRERAERGRVTGSQAVETAQV